MEVNNIDELYNAMVKNLDSHFRTMKSKNVRKFIVDNFNRDFVWDSLRKEYSLLIKNSK